RAYPSATSRTSPRRPRLETSSSRMIFMRAPRPLSLGRLGQQGDSPGPADGAGQLPLMPAPLPGVRPRRDLPPLRDEPLQPPDVLVVDQAQLVDAELADFAAPETAPLDGLARRWNSSFLLLDDPT